MKKLLLTLVVLLALEVHRHRSVYGNEPGDWPMLGRTISRNPVVPDVKAPHEWDIESGKNIKWSAKLGSQTYGTPAIAGGQVYVGTNNRAAYLERYPANVDLGCLLCFRQSDGEFLWQFSAEKLPQGRTFDWPMQGMGCTPLVEGERMWLISNRWEVVCLDTQGFRDQENDGPFDREPVVGPLEADVIWKFDLIGNFNMHPHSAGMGPHRRSSIAAYGDHIYLVTGNGVDESHTKVPTPEAPSLVCLNKNTAEVVWTDASPGQNILHTQLASPLVAEIAGRAQVIVPQGDGWLRSFDPITGRILWEFDLNPKHAKWFHGFGTRNNILAAPVLYENRIYIGNGQDMEHGEGFGRLVCIDPTGQGDISSELAVDAANNPLPHRRLQAVDPARGERAVPNPNSGLVWEFTTDDEKYEQTFHRMISSVAIHNGLVIANDVYGLVHCLSAETGEQHWAYDVLSPIWTSPLIVGETIYVADEDHKKVTVFRLSADPKRAMKPGDSDQAIVRGQVRNFVPIAELDLDSYLMVSPVFANGVLYVTTRKSLHAIGSETKDAKGAEQRSNDDAREKVDRTPRPDKSDLSRIPKSAFVPTPADVVARMLELADVKQGDVVCDLGSGDGRIPIMAAREFGARALGFEIDDELVEQSRSRAEAAGVADRVVFHHDDLFNADLSNVDVLTLYLYPVQNRKLIERLQKLDKGVRIVTHRYELPGVRAESVNRFESSESGETHVLFRYTTPLVMSDSSK